MDKYRMRWGLLVFLVTWTLFAKAQVNRYFIEFTDKEGSSFSVDRPEEFLSERAIIRRQKHNTSIGSEDLPVNASYIKTVETAGAEVYFTSRWFNGAISQMDESLVSQIAGLEFVTRVLFIANGNQLSRAKESIKIPDTFLAPEQVRASTTLQLGMINADDMHEAGYTGDGIRIAVLDGGFSGVNLYKPFEHLHQENKIKVTMDLIENSGNPYQYSGHGTSVLSTIAARYEGFSGTAFGSEFLIYVTEDVRSEYRIEEYNWLVAAEHADSAGTDIIHSSVGYNVFNDGTMNYEYKDMNGQTTVITRAADMAFERGILVVTSAGNEGNNPDWPYITAPADAVNILSVGSITENYEKSGFSSVGPTFDGRIKPDVVALGSRTAIVRSNGNIETGNGTSYSAPIISGLAAGIWEANPGWTNVELANAIRTTASRAFEPDTIFGYGVPNYNNAVMGRVLAVSDILSDKVKVFPNPFRDNKIFIDFSHHHDLLPIMVLVYDTRGTLIAEKEFISSGKDIFELDINSSEKGLYFLTLNSPRKFSKHIKLLKY